MILAIKQFFEDKLSVGSEQENSTTEKKLELASAALMFELMRTDSHIDQREKNTLILVLQETFDLDDAALHELVEIAEDAAVQATSLYEFTSLVNENYSYEQRVQLIENLWRIAFADHSIDRYEEHMIRKVGDLIYIRHSDFIRTKLRAKERLK